MFESISAGWAEASGLERLSFVLALIGGPTLTGFSGYLLSLRYIRGYRAQNRRLSDENAKLETQRDAALAQADREQKQALEWQPARWLERARKERAQGNEEVAIGFIRAGLDRMSPDLADCAVALAGHHLSLVVGPDPVGDLATGTRFAKLAVALNPDDSNAAFLHEEAELLAALGQEKLPKMLSASLLPHDLDEAEQLVVTIQQYALSLIEQGFLHVAVRLLRRAELIVKRVGTSRTELGLAIMQTLTEILPIAGFIDEASLRIDDLLLARDKISGDRDPETLKLRNLEVTILTLQGRHPEALARVTALLHDLESILDPEHAIRLNALENEASILSHLGQHRSALDKIQKLLPVAKRTLGSTNALTLAISHLETKFLNNCCEYKQAREKIDDLLPVLTSVRGTKHPSTLGTLCLEADVLRNVGEEQLALEKLASLLPNLDDRFGVEHFCPVGARHLQAEILNSLGRYREAFDVIESLVPMLERTSGPKHPNTLTTCLLEVVILANLHEREQARSKISRLWPIIESVLPPEHPSTQGARALFDALIDG